MRHLPRTALPARPATSRPRPPAAASPPAQALARLRPRSLRPCLLSGHCGWHIETTFEEARRHLGLETQRQWSDLAIARTKPALLGLFSLVTLLADQRLSRSRVTVL